MVEVIWSRHGRWFDDITHFPILNLLLEHMVALDDLGQLVGQIILRSRIVVLDHGGTYLGRRNGQDGTDHPVRAAPVAAETHEIHILI
jgi:hypothetical protein